MKHFYINHTNREKSDIPEELLTINKVLKNRMF